MALIMLVLVICGIFIPIVIPVEIAMLRKKVFSVLDSVDVCGTGRDGSYNGS